MKPLTLQSLFTQLTAGANYFNIPHFLFLRKCVVIRNELSLMGYPNTRVQIRNIPVGSGKYWLCYPDLCSAYGYQVKKNEAGEIEEIVNRTILKMKQEIIDYKDLPKEQFFAYIEGESMYQIAAPSPIEFHVFEDEKLDYQTTDMYTFNAMEMVQFINELKNNSEQIFITVPEIEAWLKRHAFLYWTLRMDWNILAYRSFQNLYSTLQNYAEDLQYIAEARQAVTEFAPLDEDWLYKYDRLYFTALMSWESGYEVFHEDPFILKQEFSNLHLVGEEFRALYEFPKLFVQEQARHKDN